MSETTESVAPEPEVAAPEPSPAADLRSAISAAFDEAEKATGGEGEAPQRDERGRFVGAASEEAPEAEAEPEAPAEEAKAPEPAAPVVPPEVAAIQPVLDRYKPLYAARGIPPEQALAGLFEAQKVLEERPVEAIQALARQFGVDLRQFGAQPAQTPQAPTAPQTNDPAMAAVLAEVQQLKQFVTTQQQQAVAAENAKVEQTIQAFASDPKHSHFPAVRHMMGALMQAAEAKGETLSMADAYEAACRAHPQVHKAIQQTEAEAKAKADAEARAKAAAAAKAKAVSVRGSVPVPGNRAPPSSLRGMLESAWDGRLN